jgi:hypothetical protein
MMFVAECVAHSATNANTLRSTPTNDE